MTSDIDRLTINTTSSGSMARPIGGIVSLCCPRWISAGSNSRAVVASSRTRRSSAAASGLAPSAAP
jgi:hypothetical protein